MALPEKKQASKKEQPCIIFRSNAFQDSKCGGKEQFSVCTCFEASSHRHFNGVKPPQMRATTVFNLCLPQPLQSCRNRGPWGQGHTCGGILGQWDILLLDLTSIGFTNLFRYFIFNLPLFTNADVVTIKDKTLKEIRETNAGPIDFHWLQDSFRCLINEFFCFFY